MWVHSLAGSSWAKATVGAVPQAKKWGNWWAIRWHSNSVRVMEEEGVAGLALGR